MEVDPFLLKIAQPTLFDLGESSSGFVELFPAVWNATEALTSPDLKVRRAGLDELVALNAARLSPLVAYVLATRLLEPDIALRADVVRVVAGLLIADAHGRPAPEPVRLWVVNQLAQMRTRQVFALLQVAHFDPSLNEGIGLLFNACAYAGNHLAEILANRKAPLHIRRQAALFTGRIGYVSALPVLERLVSRLEARHAGQQAMPFAPHEMVNEVELLPDIQASLALLRAP